MLLMFSFFFVFISDPVEFQLSCDRRSGKRIAISVIKVDPSVSSQEIFSEERFQGSIVQEAKPVKTKNVRLYFCFELI